MSLTKVTYSMIYGAPVLVDDFIPAGVDTEATDVSSYIQDAIDSLPLATAGIKGHLCLSNKRYNLGTPSGATPAILIDRPMLFDGNGATFFVDGASTGRTIRVNSPFVTIQNLVITKSIFSLTNTASLTGEALNMYADATRSCQKWQLQNIEITGYQYGMTFTGAGAGCSYGDVYSPRIRFTAYGMVFDATDLDASYCTNINVYGGELSLDGFGTYSNCRGIDIRNTNSHHATNGINFYGTNVEGHWIRKLYCEGQDCSFNELYWDATNGGTDIEFANNATSGQLSKNNLIIGGSPLWQQVVANTSGYSNSLIDPTKGIGFGNPVLASTTAFQFTQLSAGGGAVKALIGNSYQSALNNSAFLGFQCKTGAGTLVDFGGISASISNTAGNGSGQVSVAARNSGGYLIGVLIDGETGSFYANIDNVQSCGTASNRWSVVYAGTGTINTSDENEKTDIRPLDYKEKAAALAIKARIKAFKFNDAVEKKGDKARIHFGVMAQDVKNAFETEGLVAEEYGVFCSDKLEDGSVRLGVRYDELFAFILGAI